MKRSLATKLTIVTSATALALGAAACDVEDPGDLNDLEDPVLEDEDL